MVAEPGFWRLERFPVVYEQGEPKAVIVDVDSFAQVELILDNLLNREGEPEDAVIAASLVLRQQLAKAREQAPSEDWEQELDEL